ncbi:MAG: protein-L-isoaspartate O-methyltransferase [Nanoarchaeota archaeon]|nr:protein-L-isoaspartate O-methyltransferase [Nanoarchaeota archaeon]
MNKKELMNSLKQKGFSEKIIGAFERVSREKFVPEKLKPRSYEDTALPIGEGQTISQPYTIAMMLSLLELRKNQKVLEIGSGCGYVLALLSELVGETSSVFGIEIIKELAKRSRNNLRNYKNIKVYNKNGAEGLESEKPLDRILISAALDKIPEKLTEQLKDKGILVAPLGNSYIQSLVKFQKINNKLILKEQIPGFVFVRFVSPPAQP